MGKRILAFLAALFCGIICCIQVEAKNQVSSIDIDVELRQDGSAVVTQIWTTDTDEGTEFYLTCKDSGYLSITDFSVSDEKESFTFLENWDVDASLEDKAHKYGIHEINDGVELCWGIGKYGSGRYTIKYILHDLVCAYSDADGFNFRFVDKMNTFPTDVSLTIRRENGGKLSDEICDIWAFGYDGDIWFDNGGICARSTTALEDGQHMTVMVSVEKGILLPLRQIDDSFETVKESAFKGSNYEDEAEGGFAEFAMGAAVLILIGGLIVLWVKAVEKVRKIKMNRRARQVEYFREAPNGNNLNVTYQLGTACELCKENSLLGVYLLRLINDGSLEPDDTSVSSQVDLRLVCPPRGGNPYDDAFYTILEAAAGADGILQAKELEKFCNQNAKPLADFVDSCKREADQTLIRAGCYRGAVCKGVKSLTQQGNKQLDEILGFKRFLLDFSLIHERGVKETAIWQDYLIYAYLLGIADQVMIQIRRLYPETLPQVEHFNRCIGYVGYYNSFMYRAYSKEQQRQAAARSAGSEGRASFGGGGGFSGGGGGGTR